MDEIKERGFESVMQESISIVTSNTKCFGLSIDLDGFDPLEAPGVGSPVPDGLLKDEVLPGLHDFVANHSKFSALEIAEFNPHRDKDFLTAQLTVDIAESLLA